ncbi:MAG: hypothetical protein ACTSPI_01905 [Candidatus Heimdallarchaeaceae archaeon]
MNEKFKTKKRITQFEWWVTPLNIITLSAFFIILDLSTGTGDNAILGLDWALWPPFAFVLLYVMNLIVVSKPELSWAVGPVFFLVISVFLIILDRYYGSNLGWLGLDWAQIPVATILIFGKIIPTVTHLGKKKMTAKERFEEFRKALEEDTKKD